MSVDTPDTDYITYHFAYETITLSSTASQLFRLTLQIRVSVLTPLLFLIEVWPLPISLATTFGISFDFSSSAYLDVSVQRVPFVNLSLLFQLTIYSYEL